MYIYLMNIITLSLKCSVELDVDTHISMKSKDKIDTKTKDILSYKKYLI